MASGDRMNSETVLLQSRKPFSLVVNTALVAVERTASIQAVAWPSVVSGLLCINTFLGGSVEHVENGEDTNATMALVTAFVVFNLNKYMLRTQKNYAVTFRPQEF